MWCSCATVVGVQGLLKRQVLRGFVTQLWQTPTELTVNLLGDFNWWRYQKQIENAGRKILGQEKFAELKNMVWPAC